MTISNHPFEFKTRFRDLQDTVPNPVEVQLLEERDRDLEDFLATMTGGSSGLMASSLSRSTNQTTNAQSATINMTTTDYLSGCSVSSYNGGACLQVDTPGVWHCTAAAPFPFTQGTGTGNAWLAQRRAGALIQLVFEYVANGGPYVGDPACNLSADFLCQAGDLIIFSIVGDVNTVQVGIQMGFGMHAYLQAHLVG